MDRKLEVERSVNSRERNKKINKIPDYEQVFSNGETTKTGGKGFIRKLLRNNRKDFVCSIIAYVIKALPVWVIPVVTADIIDLITTQPENFIKKIVIDALILFISLIQNVPVHTLYSKIVNKMIRNTVAGVKGSVVRKLQRLSITYHNEMEGGKIQSKFLRDIDGVESYFRNFILGFIPTVIGVIVSIGISLFQSPIVTLFFVAIVPLNVLLVVFFNKKIRTSNSLFRIENENLSSKLTTMLQMLTLTKAHGLVSEQTALINDSIKSVTKAGLKVDMVSAYFGSVSWAISQFLSVVCLLFCAFLAINGHISTGEVVLFQSLFSSINSSVLTLINIFPVLASGRESVLSLSEIMRAEDIEHDSNKRVVPEIQGQVEFVNVSYHYPGSDKDVVKNFNLNVKIGEKIAVVGSSGSGKSTIMNLIIGLLKPTQGRIYVDGKPLDELPMQAYRHYISVVPQNSILFSGTIKENITYGLSHYDEEILNTVVKDSNITEFLPSLPHGLDTQVGEHGDKLSGGQKQRVCIARALIRNPRILIMDEATSALDNASEHHVQKAIDTLIKNRTTFIVAHRLSTIRNADRIVVMENGCIVEIGTYDELIALNGRFAELDRLNKIKNE